MKQPVRLSVVVLAIVLSAWSSFAQEKREFEVPAYSRLMLAASESSIQAENLYRANDASEHAASAPWSAPAPAGSAAAQGTVHRDRSSAPFRAFGVDAKLGLNGIGFDAATSLLPRINLRGGATFLGYSTNVTIDNVNYSGDLKLRSGRLGIDFLPFGGGFYISGGVEMYNGNQLSASATILGGQTFTINQVNYFSSASTPVQSSITAVLGSKAAPTITIGHGNILPRRGGRITVPVEFGIAYVGSPTINLVYSGMACTASATAGCQPIPTSTSIQQNIQAQQSSYQSDLSALRIYPILSIGVGYRIR